MYRIDLGMFMTSRTDRLKTALSHILEKCADDWEGPSREMHPGTQRTLEHDYADPDHEPQGDTPLLHGSVAPAKERVVSGKPSDDIPDGPIGKGVPPSSNAPDWFYSLNS